MPLKFPRKGRYAPNLKEYEEIRFKKDGEVITNAIPIIKEAISKVR